MVGELSKLLGTAYGLKLELLDVDNLLMNKIKKKITFYGSRHLSLARRRLIVNKVLASMLWFSVMVWARAWKSLRNIKAYLGRATRAC
jgi:hypothetical protein